MDIIDIMLAKAMTPQGKTDAYVAKANKAAQKAAKAKQDAEAAVATVTSAASDIADAQSAAATLLETAQSALATAQAAQGELPTAYSTTGQNTDGYMTQKAVTDALDEKADLSTMLTDLSQKASAGAVSAALALKANQADMETALAAKADKTYVDEQIAAIPTGSGSGGVSNLGSINDGKLVVIGSDGNIISGTVSEEELINALIITGGYTARNAIGLEIDYNNKTFTRTQQATGKTMGTDFDAFVMYGGRKRCVVADDGTINAFYGEQGYYEDGSAGQVMIYQPKFYYQRIPITTSSNKVGKTINRDSIVISDTPQNGFKIHPLFKNASGDELDYVLLSAYEGCLYSDAYHSHFTTTAPSIDTNNDKLASRATTKPVTGSSGLTLEKAEKLANNRGSGWHIMNMAAESANQMLELIEFGTLNGQVALGKGISNITTDGTKNQAALTGSTASLGNTSGVAASTTFEVDNGTTFTETTDGKVAISYRGMENPWGNTWNMIGGAMVYGDSSMNGGVPYICSDFTYSYNNLANNYHSIGFSLPNSSDWISALGYGDKAYDWVLMPATAGENSANSTLPVGDAGWFNMNLNNIRMICTGGSWPFEDRNGLLYYACDRHPTDSQYKSYGARLMFIPTKNSIYTANIAKWQQTMGG